MAKFKERYEEVVRDRDALKVLVGELEKKLESEKTTAKYHSGRAEEANKELEQMHDVLDSLPCALPRDMSNGYSKRTAMVRFAAWLAVR
jgi:predicted translin family RNA/ssDNA-binding protein